MKDLLNIGLDKHLGSGMADKAAQTIAKQPLRLKEQECQALGMEYDPEADTCRKVSTSEPRLDK
jgi:hypothetical protein